MVFGKATVFHTFSLDAKLCLCARYQWLQGAAVLVPSSAHPTCYPTAETIALVQNRECARMAFHLHIVFKASWKVNCFTMRGSHENCSVICCHNRNPMAK